MQLVHTHDSTGLTPQGTWRSHRTCLFLPANTDKIIFLHQLMEKIIPYNGGHLQNQFNKTHFVDQPTSGIFCSVHTAPGKATDILLSASPADHKSIITLLNPLYLQTSVKTIGKLILPCLEAHLGDLITFQPRGHLQPGMTSRDALQPTGSSGTKGSFQNTHGIVQPAGTTRQLSRSADVKEQSCN